jgi:uncharacterized protein YndB with AHSA1/START domain
VSASRTVGVPVEGLVAAFIDADERERWFPGAPLGLPVQPAERSARFDREDGRIRVNV